MTLLLAFVAFILTMTESTALVTFMFLAEGKVTFMIFLKVLPAAAAGSVIMNICLRVVFEELESKDEEDKGAL